MAAGAAVQVVCPGVPAYAVAGRLAARAVAVGSGAGRVAVGIRLAAFTTVAALEDAEIIHIHVVVGIKPGVGAKWVELRDNGTESAHPEVSQIRGIDIAVVVEVTAVGPGFGLVREQTDQQDDRKSERAGKPYSVHDHVSGSKGEMSAPVISLRIRANRGQEFPADLAFLLDCCHGGTGFHAGKRRLVGLCIFRA